MPTRRSAFTLLELIAVIGIIALLISVMALGLKYVLGGVNVRNTNATMESLLGLMSQHEALKKLDGLPKGGPMPAPDDLAGVDRNSPQVAMSSAVLGVFQKVPNNRQAIDKLPGEVRIAWGSLNPPAAGAWGGGASVGVHREVDPDDGNTYVCIQTHTTSNQPKDSPDYWAREDDEYPVVLDAWNNPIICVPSGGMTGLVDSDGNSIADAKSPDGRPFFASAGPDGKMTTGEDNLYSFSK